MINRNLFRGKLLDSNTSFSELDWVYGNCIEEKSTGKVYIISLSQALSDTKLFDIAVEIDPKTLCNVVPLMDKNSVTLYEHDIVKDLNGQIARVMFLQQEMGYVLVYENRDTRILGHRYTGQPYNQDMSIERIGNIFDNPELISYTTFS